MTNLFKIHDQKNKPMELQAVRAAFYERAQLVEAISDQNELYYLFFYKSEYLTIKKATKIRLHSLIERAFKNGITFDAPHPFVNSLLDSKAPLKIVNNKQLLKKLALHYTTHEKAYILTFFESFISKKQLFNEIKDMFYEFRRNGKLLNAYQLVRILKDFSPNHSLVKSLLSDLIYKDFTKMYFDRTDEMFKVDPIEGEKIMFNEREVYIEPYSAMLSNENRDLEAVVLLYENFRHSPSDERLLQIKSLLQKHFSLEDQIFVYEQLVLSTSNQTVVEQLYTLYMTQHQIVKAFKIISDYNIELNDYDLDQLGHELLSANPMEIVHHSDELQSILLYVLDSNHTLADPLLHKYVEGLLQKYDLFFIKKWLEPFERINHSLDVLKKFNQIYQLHDDLDHMQDLGELYYDFKHWDNALECFSLESELKPELAKPLKWISKTYFEMGLKDEADAYQKMFVSVQKQA